MYKRLAVDGFTFIGGSLRETLELWWPFSTNWFGTTICINIVGAFLLAMINFWVANRFALPSQIILGPGTGMIGAFTTFSSFSLEIVKLLDAGQIMILIVHVLLSIGGGVVSDWQIVC